MAQQQTSTTSSIGAAIENRRIDLGLTKAEAARRAGIGRGTWHEVENGTRSNMLPDTLNLMDEVLGWERGTLNRMARGMDAIGAPPTNGAAIEVKTALEAVDQVAENRRKLIAFAGTLAPADVERLLSYIDNDLGADTLVRRTEMDRFAQQIAAQLDSLRQRIGDSTDSIKSA